MTTKQTRHARILTFPYADSLLAARLDALHEETHGPRRELVMDYHELRQTAPPELFDHDGQPHERVQGQYFPRRIRFLDVQELTREGIYTHLETVPPDPYHWLALRWLAHTSRAHVPHEHKMEHTQP